MVENLSLLEQITPYELAILELTYDGDVHRPELKPFQPKEPIVLTTKDSYIWASSVALLLERRPDISEQEILSALRDSIRAMRETLTEYYSSYRAPSLGGYEAYVFADLHKEFCRRLHLGEEFAEKASVEAVRAYSSLIDRQYIEDPVITTLFGWPIALIGLIPYSFTKRTRRGKVIYRKIESLFWRYEMRETAGERQQHFYLKILKYLRALKRAFVEDTEDEVDRPPGS